jgi:hypothetical protein
MGKGGDIVRGGQSVWNRGESRASTGVPGKTTVAHEPGRAGIADEERSDHELELVDEVVGQELRVHLSAAFDHQPLHPAGAEILGEAAHLDPLPAVHDGRYPAESRPGIPQARARAIDDLLDVAGGEEVSVRIQRHPLGHRDLDRRGRKSARRARVAALLGAHEQPWVVVPYGGRAHQDRVTGRAHGVDPIEVGVV